MFGKLGDLDLSEFQNAFTEMQKKVKESEAEAEEKLLKAKAGGGMVEATINGKGEFVDISIDESLSDDFDSLKILLIAVVNDALKMAKEEQKKSAMNIVSNSLGGMR
ncbi:DNA-binding protein, YbaB/EbfC family [Thiovulum sp. ES]|nr:DNA-binding protein, YbaB/EbfC family [Thiovulum sp. ES]